MTTQDYPMTPTPPPAFLELIARAFDALEELDENPHGWRRLAWVLALPLLFALPFLRPILDGLDLLAEWLANRPKAKGEGTPWWRRRPSARFWRAFAVVMGLTAAVWTAVFLRAVGVLPHL